MILGHQSRQRLPPHSFGSAIPNNPASIRPPPRTQVDWPLGLTGEPGPAPAGSTRPGASRGRAEGSISVRSRSILRGLLGVGSLGMGGSSIVSQGSGSWVAALPWGQGAGSVSGQSMEMGQLPSGNNGGYAFTRGSFQGASDAGDTTSPLQSGPCAVHGDGPGGGSGGANGPLSESGVLVLNVGPNSPPSGAHKGWLEPPHAPGHGGGAAGQGLDDAASLGSSSRPSLSSSLPLPRIMANGGTGATQSSIDDPLSPFMVTGNHRTSRQSRRSGGGGGGGSSGSQGGGSRRRLFNLMKLGDQARDQLFYGLRVRMGVAAGVLPPGVDVRGSAVFELAKGAAAL